MRAVYVEIALRALGERAVLGVVPRRHVWHQPRVVGRAGENAEPAPFDELIAPVVRTIQELRLHPDRLKPGRLSVAVGAFRLARYLVTLAALHHSHGSSARERGLGAIGVPEIRESHPST